LKGGVNGFKTLAKCYYVSQKKRTNFETVKLKIITIDFDDKWQKYSKCSRIEYACFSFRAGLLFFINFSSFKQDTENNANCENYTSHCLPTWHHSEKILTEILYECKGYSAWRFITEFPDKGWTKNSINRLLVKLRKFEQC